MKDAAFVGGLAIAGLGAGVPLLLPNIPTTGVPSFIVSAGSWIIDNQSYIVLAGLILLLLSVFL